MHSEASLREKFGSVNSQIVFFTLGLVSFSLSPDFFKNALVLRYSLVTLVYLYTFE